MKIKTLVVAIAAVTVSTAAFADWYPTKASERDNQPASGSAPAVPNDGSDDCTAPPSITTLPFNDTGTTTGGNNTIGTIALGCSDYTTTGGPDKVYQFTAGASQNMNFLVTPSSGWDPSIYVVSTCSNGDSCVTGADGGLGGTAESFTFTGRPAGTYFFWVDSFYATGTLSNGGFSVAVTGTLPVELTEFSVD
jgi:hypothetical protein